MNPRDGAELAFPGFTRRARWRLLNSLYGLALCGLVDGFDEGQATAAFAAVADGLRVDGDGAEEVFEDGFVAADVGDRGGGGALVCVTVSCAGEVWRTIAQIGGDDAVVL